MNFPLNIPGSGRSDVSIIWLLANTCSTILDVKSGKNKLITVENEAGQDLFRYKAIISIPSSVTMNYLGLHEVR